jgi:release factor glutamine methyltransferase
VARLIEPGGCAAIEIGHGQADSVSALLVAEGLAPVLAHDLAGRPRALVVAG